MPRIQEFIIYTFLRIPSSSLLRTKIHRLQEQAEANYLMPAPCSWALSSSTLA